MGEYSEASIVLRARFTGAIFQSSQSGRNPRMGHLVAEWGGSIIACGNHADYNFLDIQNQKFDSQRYAFVFISFSGRSSWGLALRRRSDTEYERIGTCTCWAVGGEQLVRSYLSSLPFKEVKII